MSQPSGGLPAVPLGRGMGSQPAARPGIPPGATSSRPIPAPPGGVPADPPLDATPLDPAERWAIVRVAARFVALGAIVVIVGLGAADLWRIFGDRGALRAALDAGIGGDGPTPAVLSEFDDVLRQRGLYDAVRVRHSDISGEAMAFRIGAVIQHRIVGIPIETVVVREGRFEVASKLPTLDIYVKAGWSLDSKARSDLEAYAAGRGR